MSELFQRAGTIKNGHGSLSGFRLNTLGNLSFRTKYRLLKPNATNPSQWQTAQDGQFFSETGRYDFEVKTSLGKTKNYSIYVNNLDINAAVAFAAKLTATVACNFSLVTGMIALGVRNYSRFRHNSLVIKM